MEGRFAPPKARHPYPNNPDLTKFWGPYSRGFFKAFGVFSLGYFSFLGINMYLTREEKGPFGIDLTITPEDREKKAIFDKNRADIYHNYRFPVLYESNKTLTTERFKFDDRIYLSPPKGQIVAEKTVG